MCVKDHKEPTERQVDKAGSSRAEPTVSLFHSNARDSPDRGANSDIDLGNYHRRGRVGSIGGPPEL